jgi:hypothetical protein
VVPCYFFKKNSFLGWLAGWLAGWLGDAASLVLAPWPTHQPPRKKGENKKERKKKSIP